MSTSSKTQVPSVSWPLPEDPWSGVYIGFAGSVNSTTYLVHVDSFSKLPEIFQVVPPTVTKTLWLMTNIFSNNGVSGTMVSYNEF